ncbi:uncharacterized protein LOC131234657 [Magnolia sinica]|uniref:uncharacterized protein LOC131234657 n=1 Tax=Magnolia sinica TaxID=86752 RepID=UPI00265A785F|nr:uncharacterized protein LOC131234657 [Magnolia sinica]
MSSNSDEVEEVQGAKVDSEPGTTDSGPGDSEGPFEAIPLNPSTQRTVGPRTESRGRRLKRAVRDPAGQSKTSPSGGRPKPLVPGGSVLVESEMAQIREDYQIPDSVGMEAGGSKRKRLVVPCPSMSMVLANEPRTKMTGKKRKASEAGPASAEAASAPAEAVPTPALTPALEAQSPKAPVGAELIIISTPTPEGQASEVPPTLPAGPLG